MCEAKRQNQLTHKFSISVSGRACSYGCSTLRFVVSDVVYFSSEKGRLMCDDSNAIIPPPLLQYYEVKIQMLSVFAWKPAREMPRYVKIQFPYFQKRAVRSYSNCGGK